ncbi:MAG: gluconate 2-dehydrogenase subunit 3 family protein [Haloferacaceae archaeon]
MELTRRDAAAALAAIGAAGGVTYGAHRLRQGGDGRPDDGRSDGELPEDERVRATLVAVAEVVYPEGVTGIQAFVDGFLAGRLRRDEHARGMREAVADLEEAARSWHGNRVAELPVEERNRLLREVGADTADEEPGGTTAERIRYYVVNELLLALYSSPTGGELVGIENPIGHPGGIESYRRGPG